MTDGNLLFEPGTPVRRVAIIGNSGSGKSHLARALSAKLNLPVIQLDHLVSRPGRPNPAAGDFQAETGLLKDSPAWIVEGLQGEWAARFLDRAELLIWLDMPWETCRDALLARYTSGNRIGPLRLWRVLLSSRWYWKRQDDRSFSGHARLFREFPRRRLRFVSREETNDFIVRHTRLRLQNTPAPVPPGGWLAARSGRDLCLITGKVLWPVRQMIHYSRKWAKRRLSAGKYRWPESGRTGGHPDRQPAPDPPVTSPPERRPGPAGAEATGGT